MPHIILLGDSIFDNVRYVPDRPPVIEQVRRSLPPGWQATLLAVDGDCAEHVERQLTGLPDDVTHLFVSVGGNDALGESSILAEPVTTISEAMRMFQQVLDRFEKDYHAMLRKVLAKGKPTTLCTIYDSIPGFDKEALTALGGFNDVILRAAFVAGLPVIDLRLICTHPDDYSPVSPIEPSMTGGAKIARRIAEVATKHDFSHPRCVIYT